MLDETTAVERARAGDEDAWRHLFDRHADFVFRLACRTLGERDAALDVVQETFIRASRALDGFRGESAFRSWLASIALNEARSWLRRRAGRREVALEAAPPMSDGARPPDARAASADLARRALSFIRRLPDLQRDVVLLRATEGCSYREIAEMLGTTEGSARVSYHHGMSKVREYLAGLEDTEEEAGSSGEAAGGIGPAARR